MVVEMNTNERLKNKKYVMKSNKEPPSENQYYLAIAKKFKSAKHVLTIILVIYLLIMIILYRDQLTVENFRYFVKYLDTTSPEYTGQMRTIHYDPAAELRIDLYKGDLVVARSKSIVLYNMIGNVMMNYNINYNQPVLITSKRNMLVYSQGDYSYTINNAFSQLHSEIYEYPISGAAMSDSGIYAIISRSLEYRSVVNVYDRDFNMISQIFKDKLVMDVQINSVGNEIIILSSYNQNGEFYTEIMTVSPYSETETSMDIQTSTFGVKTKFNSLGGYAVVCDNQLLFYNEHHKHINTFSYKGYVPLHHYLGSDYTAVVFNENIVGSNNSVYIFNKQGELVYNDVLDGQISEITGNDKFVYVLFNDKVIEINIAAESLRYSDLKNVNAMNIILKDSDKLVICYPQSADIYIIEELFDSGGINELYN